MHLLQGGIDLIKIRDLLGHKSVSTTEIYAKTFDRDLHNALRKETAALPSLASWHQNPGIMEQLNSFAKQK